MNDLINRIEKAKADSQEMNALVKDYMPLLKKEVGRFQAGGQASDSSMSLAYDEKLSLAMLTFVNCIRQYEVDRGNFISYLSVSIRNRLIDQSKANYKDSKVISIINSDTDISDSHTEANNYIENMASLQEYNKEKEEQNLRDEILAYNQELEKHSLSLTIIKDNCPSQKRSRKLCIKIARTIWGDENYSEKFNRTGQLPQAELALKLKISTKSIEKYRRYIVGLLILLDGDYSAITSFIPFWTEEDS